ncbi:MAG: thioredoxin family protein [Nitrososphaerales archaeon]
MKLTPFINKSQFESELLTSQGPRIIVFAAPWCGYCHRFLDLANSTEIKGEISVVDADDDGESLWDEFKIPLVPTIIVLKNGKELFRQNGRAGIGLVKSDLERAVAVAASAI